MTIFSSDDINDATDSSAEVDFCDEVTRSDQVKAVLASARRRQHVAGDDIRTAWRR
jgi:hypothetical protein